MLMEVAFVAIEGSLLTDSFEELLTLEEVSCHQKALEAKTTVIGSYSNLMAKFKAVTSILTSASVYNTFLLVPVAIAIKVEPTSEGSSSSCSFLTCYYLEVNSTY